MDIKIIKNQGRNIAGETGSDQDQKPLTNKGEGSEGSESDGGHRQSQGDSGLT